MESHNLPGALRPKGFDRRLCAGLVALALVLFAGCAPRETDRVAREIRRLTEMSPGDSISFNTVAGDSLTGSPTADDSAAAMLPGVREFYSHRNYRPAWCDSLGPTSRGRAAIEALEKARGQGLEPATYGATALARQAERLRKRRRGAPPPSPEQLAHFDVTLARALLRFGHDLMNGRVSPDSLDADWKAPKRTSAAERRLGRMLATDSLTRALESLGARDLRTANVREALRRHLKIAAAGGWPSWPAKERREDGTTARRLARLLRATGDLERDRSPGRFDGALRAALKSFQSRHGVRPTGRLDSATSAQLAIPVEKRIEALVWNLERLRWRARPLEEPRIEVNIPDFRLAMRDSGRILAEHAIVVGLPSHPTPVFSDVVTFIEVNPRWTLTKRIVAEEILPALARDTGFVTSRGLEVWRTDGEELERVMAGSVDWSSLASDSFPFIIRQAAGPENPLGLVKFMCPNEYDVYLHDTSARNLFEQPRRAFSHGCVRVQDPLEVAAWLLRGTQLETPDSLAYYLDSGTWTRVGLKRKIPVDFEYRTAWVDTLGKLQFRADVYGLDRRLSEAREQRMLRRFTLNPNAAWAAP